MFTRGSRRQVGGVNVLVKGDCGPFFSVQGCQVGCLLAWQDDVSPGCHLIVQGEVTRTGGLESNFCFLADLLTQKKMYFVTDDKMMQNETWTQSSNTDTKQNHIQRIFLGDNNRKESSIYLKWSAGILNLDVTPAGRVPATDRQVAWQVLVSYSLAINWCHLGLYQ